MIFLGASPSVQIPAFVFPCSAVVLACFAALWATAAARGYPQQAATPGNWAALTAPKFF